MKTDLKFAESGAQFRADEIEAAACRDYFAAAPAEMQVRSQRIGSATLLIAPTIPTTYFNRVIGLGNREPATPENIERIVEVYASGRVSSYWVHVVPVAQPPALCTQLEQRGFSLPKRRSWAKFLRDVDDAPAPSTDLQLRPATEADATAVGDIVSAAFGMPPPVGAWFGALIGRPNWHVWVGQAAGRVVATGSLFIQGDIGWLGVGATLAEWRGHGAQSALLAARIRVAAELGCREVCTETGEPVENEANPSLANIRRAGFVQVCSRLNYAAPPAQ